MNTVKVSEEMEDLEELTVRIETRKRILNVICFYGKTENREPKEKIENNLIILRNLYTKQKQMMKTTY